MKPLFFASPAEWRQWLSRHHRTVDELWVGFYKRASGRPSITWPEAVDEALCFGWIDGLRKSVDEASYTIRFTPRRTGSTWSAVNVRRATELTRRRRMRAAGSNAFQARTTQNTAVYSFEQRRKAVTLPPAYARRLKANAVAWRFFSAQAPWYQRTAIWWVISAKQEQTRRRRLTTLIEDSSRGRTLPALTRPKTR